MHEVPCGLSIVKRVWIRLKVGDNGSRREGIFDGEGEVDEDDDYETLPEVSI